MLNPEGLAELSGDFTGKYITAEIASQVTVLKIYDLEKAKRGWSQQSCVGRPESKGAQGFR